MNDVNDENVRMKLRVLELEHQVVALKAEIAEATANNINCRNKMGQFKVSGVLLGYDRVSFSEGVSVYLSLSQLTHSSVYLV